MKLFARQTESRLSKFTYRIKCPKCGEYSDKINTFFHRPCGSCGFVESNGRIRQRPRDYREVGKWEITETKFKVFGVSFKKVTTFEWIPSIETIEDFDFVRDELEQDFYY